MSVVDVRILPPYRPSLQEQQQQQLYADNVRALMARELGMPLSAQGHDEYVRLGKAGASVDWRGRRVVLPAGPAVLDEAGTIHLPHLD